MPHEPQFELTDKARRFLATHPGPLGAEYQPRDRQRRDFGPIRVVPIGKRGSN